MRAESISNTVKQKRKNMRKRGTKRMKERGGKKSEKGKAP